MTEKHVPREPELPEPNRLVLAHLVGEKSHSGVSWKREGFAFMVRWTDSPQTVADGWARDRYDAALRDIDADLAVVDSWLYLDDARAKMTPVDGDAAPDADAGRVAELEREKDGAYLERNRIVAALAKLFPSGLKRTNIPGWSDDWQGCVYIDLPTGQASWHYHDSHAHLFDGLPPYGGDWDGHTTEEKYQRLSALEAGHILRGRCLTSATR